MSGHVLPARTYYAVFFALLLLTAVTTAVAYFDLGPLNTIVALAIAVTKGTLVVLYFMHVKFSPRLIGIMVVAGIFWLLVLFTLSMGDYMTRVPVVGWE